MQREIQLLCGVIFALSLAIAPQPLDLAERVSGPSQEQLLDAASDDRNWILQAHAYEGNRFLRNSSLTTHSVARLRRAWTYRIDDNTPIESSGLEWSGTIYVTSGHNNVYAVDALSGVERWRFTYHGSVFAFAVNRGLAIKDGVLFMGTTDGHVLALRATDGHVLWNVVGVLDRQNTFFSMAPLVYRNAVIIGAANGDWGGRGYVVAFDAATGKRLWIWFTVPAPGEFGNSSWGGDSWKRGGAAAWGGLTLDPRHTTLYVDTGNPEPDYLGSARRGANLYSDSMIALDISGKSPRIRWYNQFIPHDTHDWDIAMPAVLVRGSTGGASRDLAIAGDKSGTLRIVDRTSGRTLHDTAVSVQRGHSLEPDARGTFSCPNTWGGVQFNGGSYLPQTNTFYVPSTNMCGVWIADKHATYVPGEYYLGGVPPPWTGKVSGSLTAVDVSTGAILWQHHFAQPANGGALVTDGGVVFSGDFNGYLNAFDARTGRIVWRDRTSSTIDAPPIAYRRDGHQFVVVASGFPNPHIGWYSGCWLTAYVLDER
jgi:alcohol dehydrogenase (cytochrome c)